MEDTLTDELNHLTLVVVETAHIQLYIFNSNRLKENVGASYLVAAATGEWALECAYKASGGSCNVVKGEEDTYTLATEQNNVIETKNAEVLYSGGGNFVAMFRQLEQAKDFIGCLSRRAICEAPGLPLTFHHQSFDWKKEDALSVVVEKALNALKSQRSHQPMRMGLAGLGVTVMCASTSLPAVWMDRERNPDEITPAEWQPVSAEVMAKRAVAKPANDYLEKTLNLSTNYRFALDLDDLGRTKGESSYMAVVHADSNGMGSLIQEIASDKNNRSYVNEMRTFSENVKKAALEAQQAMVRQLLDSIETVTEPDKDGNPVEKQVIMGENNQSRIELSRDKKTDQYILPLRPLVSGGDDVTFVCDGRIGIDLATTFLQAFEAATQQYLGQKLTACAGVAIVKSHYPFARAYALADELAASAKNLVYQDAQEHNEKTPRFSAIDWHYTPGGLYDSLDKMREREYMTKEGWLTLRPLFLGDHAHEYRTWNTFQRVATGFQTASWRGHRSKAKRLMEALREGPDAALVFKTRYLAASADESEMLKLPHLPEEAGFHTNNGWRKERQRVLDGREQDIYRCGYYDALELMDLYFPLRGKQGNATENYAAQ